MRIVCPACAATYEVPPTLLKPGLAVRCARCAGEWVPMQVAPEPQPVVPAPAPMEPMLVVPPFPEQIANRPPPTRSPPARRKPRRSAAPLLTWIASIAILTGLAGAAYIQRAEVMRIWPPSARLFDALGLLGDR